MNEAEPTLPSQEKAPEYMKVFRIRHGETEYKEQTIPGGISEDETDLTPKGQEQIKDAALKIASKLDKEKDVIFVASSPRRRTRDTAEIIRTNLKGLGFEMWAENRSQEHLIQNRVRNIDIFDENKNSLDTTDPTYAGIFNQALEDVKVGAEKTGTTTEEYFSNNGHPAAESFESTATRSRDQLTYLVRIARTIQPKLTKRLVLIQAEHLETLDDFSAEVTKKMRTEKTNTGMKRGEVLEIDIPTTGDELKVQFIDQEGPGNTYTVRYDATSRRFLSEDTKAL